MLSAVELGTCIDERLTRSAFRLEVLPQYLVDSDGDDFKRFLAGEAAPTPERKTPWLRRLIGETAAGIRNHRVQAVRRPLTDYLRFEAEWGHAYNAAAGEDIRILDLTESALPEWLTDHDFWLIDDEYPIRMYYDEDGRFLGADPVPDLLDRYRRTRDAAVASAEPFALWWATHPEEHRRAQAV